MATDEKTSAKLFPGIVIGVVLVVAISFALNEYREARWYAVHSYVLSACSAVESFRKDNGHFPRSLDEIDKSMLDYDLGIPLEELDYEITETGHRVSYQPHFGQEVSCP